MALAVKLLRWSRGLHKWVGVYVSILTVIWLAEMVVLPFVFNPGVPVMHGTLPSTEQHENVSLSFEQVLQAFMSRQPSGIDSVNEFDEISYLPKNGVYRFVVREKCLEWYVDAGTAEVLAYGFNANRFLMSKSMLGWVHPVVAEIIRAPFELLFVVLAVTGCYLVLYRGQKKKRGKSQFFLMLLFLICLNKFISYIENNTGCVTIVDSPCLSPSVSATEGLFCIVLSSVTC